jgi:site-specific recombinase XerD
MTTLDLQQQLETYAELRGALGFALGSDLKTLQRFVAFAGNTADSGPVTTRMVFDWLDRESRLSKTPASVRLSVVRQFLRHVSASVPETAIPDLRLLAGRRRTIPFIFTEQELVAVMSTASTLETLEPFRQVTIHTLLGLLASTGLRISEATGLERADVMPRSNPDILYIRETKFQKSRMVPVHPSTRCQLVTYAGDRELLGYGRQTSGFFVGRSGGRISRTEVYDAFHQIIL